MTAAPLPHLSAHPQPMTAADYYALPEDPDRNYELQNGFLVMSAQPVPRHQRAMKRLILQLDSQLPKHLELLPEVDLDLELAPPTDPGTVRSPDLVVVTQEALLRVDDERGFLRSAECVLAIEIHSPGTRRTDQVVKRQEYADAGIGHYWMVDLLGGPSLTACHAGGAFGFVDEGPFTGTFTTQHPFPARVDLAALV